MRQTESLFCVLPPLGTYRLSSYPSGPRLAPNLYKNGINRIVFRNTRPNYYFIGRQHLRALHSHPPQ